MKRFSKALLVTVLALAMVLNTCGIVLADGVTVPTVTVTEEVVNAEAGIKKLVFTLTTPAGSAGVTSTGLSFSFDNTVIQPVEAWEDYADVNELDSQDPFEAYTTTPARKCFSIAGAKWVVKGNRTGIKVDTYNSNNPCDATTGMVFTSFFYKVKEGKTANSETFKFETEYTDGSIYAGLCPDVNTAYAVNIGLKDGVKYYYGTPSTTDVEAIARPSMTYTGSDVLVLGSLAISAAADSVVVPTVYDDNGVATNATAVKLNLTATAKSTIDTDMDVPADAEWDIRNVAPVEGVSISGTGANAVLTVAPGAAAGTVTVGVTAGELSKATDIRIVREKAIAPTAMKIKADGEEITTETITVVKPAGNTAKSVTFSGEAFDQYGAKVNGDVVFSVSEADLDTGITFASNVLTLTKEAPECNINAEATFGTLTREFSIDVVGLAVNWSEVETTDITYGATNASAITLPAEGKGTASVDGEVVNGVYTIVDPEVKQGAGARTVSVKFTANSDEGDYAGVEIINAFDIEIAKATTVITAADVVATYNGNGVSVTATTNRDEETTINYELVGSPTSVYPPVIAGEYVVHVYVAESDNWAKAEKNVNVKINKAPVVITAADATFTYDGTAKEITATVDNEDSRIEYAYAMGGAAVSAAIDAGTYTVTVNVPATTNYEAATKDVTLTIEKSTATAFVTEAPVITTDAEAYYGTTLADTKANLPATATVSYGGDKTAEVEMTWADATEALNAKGGTYTFVGTPSSDNLAFGSLTLTAKLIVEAVTGELETAIPDVFIKKAQLEEENKVSYADVNLPWSIVILASNGTRLEYADVEDAVDRGYNGILTWNKTLEELSAMNVGDKTDVTVTTVFPEWLTFTGDLTAAFEVTDKDPVTVTVTQANGVYGTALEAPVAGQTDAGYGVEAEEAFEYAYTGTTAAGVAYESENAPTAAGSYTVTATLVSGFFAGSGSANFTIAAKEITATIGDATKVYGDANPTFALAATPEGIVGEDNLYLTFYTVATAGSNVGTYDITAEAANKNYAVTFTNGTLTIEPKDLANTDFVPVITGDTARGTTLSVVVNGLAADQYDVAWNSLAMTSATYTLSWADSNKAVTAEITGKGNYTGTKAAAEFAIPKYEISGVANYTLVNGGDENKLDAGDTITADTTAIDDIANLELAGATFTYSWTIDGTEVATTAEYTVPSATVGVLVVTITAEGDFAGSVTATIGEIGKAPLAGTITITEATGVLTAAASLGEATADDYDLKWFRGETELTVNEDGTYTVTSADYGQTITVKAIAKGALYTGEVVATYNVPAIAPSNVEIATVASTDSITVTLTADANGAAITSFEVTITDGDAYTETVTVTATEGVFTHKFESLTTGAKYTLTATATNSAGTSTASTPKEVTVAAAQSSSGLRPAYRPTTTPTTPDSGESEGTTGSEGEGEGTTTPDADVTVKVEDTTASIDKEVLKDKEAVEVATATESGTEVKTTVNVADADVASLEVSTKDSDKAAAGAAAEGAIGTPVEVKVDAKDAEGNAADVTVNVTIASEEKAYAYIIDENGVAVRTESVYNEETGEVEVANVPDGAVVMLSTTAPATFDDAADHWAEDTINYAVDAGIMNGVGGGAFDPNGEATRGMVNAMMVRLAKVAGVEIAEAADQKVDTDTAHWAAATDLIALANGWSTGVRTLEDGTVVMDTDATVTREQLVTMLWRFVANPEADGDITSFEDHDETSDWAKEAKAWAVGAGIMNGKPGNKLDPNGTATRAEIATMFNRLMKYMTK